MPGPTNAELLTAIENQGQAFKDHAEDDHRFQADQTKVNTNNAIFMAETEGKLAKLEEMPTTKEIEHIVATAMVNVIKSKGKTFYAGLFVVAGVIGALTVIGGGLKSLLAWVGFSYLK